MKNKKISVFWVVLMLFALSVSVATAANLKIMSYNFTTGAVPADVYTIANAQSPDIIGAQACSKAAVDYFKSNGYSYVGIDRDGGTTGEYNPIFYKTDNLNMMDSGTFWLSSTPYVAGSKIADSSYIRICTWAVFREKSSYQSFIVMNTHLDTASNTVRTKQLEQLFSVAEKYSLPIVMTGSFNAQKDGTVYKKAISYGLTDAQDATTDTDSGQTWHNHGASTREKPSDFCLVDPDRVSVVSYKIIRNKLSGGTYPSTYYPVVATISIKSHILQAEMLRVMSFNVRVGEFEEPRKGYVVSTIKKYSPDLLGVQEASVEWMSYLKSNLSDYSCIGVGRDPDSTGEYSAIFYKKKMFTVIDSGTFWLSETPEECSYGWDAACRRVCTWAVLCNRHTEEVFAYFNTHLDHKSSTARVNGIALVQERIKELGLPTILTGDFNLKEGTSAYKTILANGVEDTKTKATTTDTGGTFHNYGATDTTTTKPIDFCLVTKGDFNVSTYKIVRDTFSGAYPSDHFPIYSELKLAGTNTEAENTVMSFDLSGAGTDANAVANRISRVKSVIGIYAPDVIGLQAETATWQDELSSMRTRYGYGAVGAARDGTDTGEKNRIYYLKRKYTVVKSGTFWLSKTPDVVGSSSWSAAFPRICTYVVLKNRFTKEVFAVYNTHLDHESAEARAEGIKVLLEKIKSLGYPAILMGTLQESESGTVYKTVSASMTDSKYVAASSDDGNTYHNFGTSTSTKPKDYCFVSDNYFDVAKYKIIRNKIGGYYPSPYYPVLCEFTFKYDVGMTVRNGAVTVTDTRKSGDAAYLYLATYDADGRMVSCKSSGKVTKKEDVQLPRSGTFSLYTWNNQSQPLKEKQTAK